MYVEEKSFRITLAPSLHTRWLASASINQILMFTALRRQPVSLTELSV